jgi:hypothetical protein
MPTYERPTLAEVNRTKGVRPGARALLNVLQSRTATHPGRDPKVDGIFNKRPIRGSQTIWSTHAVSRGIDLGMKVDAKGQQLGNFLLVVLLSKAEALGIQQIIWNDGVSDVVYRPGSAPQRSKKQNHKNHLHIEITSHMADTPLPLAEKWINGVLG